MCRLIAYKNKQMRNKGSYRVLDHCCTSLDSTVTAVESFRFLGTTISQDLKKDNHMESIVKQGSAEVVLPLPDEEVQPATGAAETILLCHH